MKNSLMPICALLLAACGTGGGAATPVTGSSAPDTGTPRSATEAAQNLTAVTPAGTAVTAGLVALPLPRAGDQTTFALATPPAHGHATISGATFSYAPAASFSGTDHFTYVTASDRAAPATVSIDVLPVAAPAPPSLQTACTALGSAFAPLCTTLGSITQPLVASCGSLAPTGFCSSFGGNLAGLVQGCQSAAGAQAPALCKALGDTLDGLASACREAQGPADFCALLSGQAISQPAVDAYLKSAAHRALAAQWQMEQNVPLRHTLVPATHNSYNFTTANTPPTISGLDPDQFYSMVQQLDMDMRGLELDVHWFPSIHTLGYAPILCHGETSHVGCTTERTLASGLGALRGWLEAHPDQVILLDVEQHLDDPGDNTSQSFPATAAVFEQILGATSARDLIFRPDEVYPTGSACKDHPIPLAVTLEQIRAAGKQVLIYSSGCGHNAGWDNIIFDESNRLQDEADAFGQDHYPSCDFTRMQYATHWTRFYDSSTLIDGLGGAGTFTPVTPTQITQMVDCGVNMPSINFLTPSGAQQASFVWSWAVGQPLDAPHQRCAVRNANGHLQAEACQQTLPWTCLDPDGWHVTVARGAFPGGAGACAAAFAGSHFAAPRNGHDNELLQAAQTQAGAPRAWVNVERPAGTDRWIANPVQPAATQPAR
ncbi:MAG TPA: Ig-like domain-containing protein [Nevskiaceae bacterium]|nr:Ig-like domain-containing protein [Nevskiaceae bacterium]